MVDEVEGEDPLGGSRRSTYQPPAEESLPTGSFPPVEDHEESLPDESSVPEYLPAPIRTSRSQADIMQAFADGTAGDTADMIAQLETQFTLQSEEEAAFASWSAVIRGTRPDNADAIIAYEKAIFDGGERTQLDLAEKDHPGAAEEETLPETPPEVVPDSAEPVEISLPETAEPFAEEELPESSTPVEEEPSLADSPDAQNESAPPESVPQKSLPEEPAPKEVWPLRQEELTGVAQPVKKVRARVLSPSAWASLSTWFFALIPLLGLTGGLWLTRSGLGFLEALAVTCAAALILGLVIAGVSRARMPTSDTFGTRGGIVPGSLLFSVRIATLAVVVWWAERTLVSIAVTAGWWTGPEAVAHIVAVAVLGALAVVHLFMGPFVLRITLWVSAGLGLIGTVGLVARTSSEFSGVPNLSWTGEVFDVLSLGSLLLAVGLIVLVPLASGMGGLVAARRTRFAGLVAGIAATLPLALLLSYTAWLSLQAPVYALALTEDPLRALAIGLGTWFPVPAVLGLVVPFVGILALGLSSAATSLREMSLPGPRVLHAILVGAVFTGASALALLFEQELSATLLDLARVVGVVVAAWAGAVAVNSVMPRVPSGLRQKSVRFGPLGTLVLALGLGLGLQTSSISWLSWQGYLLEFVNLESAGLQLGIIVALAVGAAGTALSGISAPARTVESHV